MNATFAIRRAQFQEERDVTFPFLANQNTVEVLSPAQSRCARQVGKLEQAILISCAQVRHELSNYIENDVTLELRARIEQHVQSCTGCKAIYDGVRNVLSLVSSSEIIELPRGFSLRLYRRLVLESPR
ncbi:MAG TPA: zf-HC2 domain-containing protein, partial [Candidatus Angelobacter sp.]|nr:zf-HC2 domain-containing protein [Candidatus Angelobacter sp.]